LRIERAEDVVDRAVLAPGVHRLEDDQQGALLFGVEEGLERGELAAIELRLLFGGVLGLVVGLERRIDVAKAERTANGHPEFVPVVQLSLPSRFALYLRGIGGERPGAAYRRL
jgi:hypothetical protein